MQIFSTFQIVTPAKEPWWQGSVDSHSYKLRQDSTCKGHGCKGVSGTKGSISINQHFGGGDGFIKLGLIVS